MLKIRNQAILGVVAAMAIGFAGAANAAPRLLERFNDWAAYVNEEGGKKLCFVISQPTSSEMNPAGRKRGPGYVFVSYRPSENVTGEVSIAFGYPLAANSTRAVIGSSTFSLFAREESAWIENAADEPKLVEAMRGGATMQLFGTSGRGTKTVDTYSLKGVTAALKRADTACSG